MTGEKQRSGFVRVVWGWGQHVSGTVTPVRLDGSVRPRPRKGLEKEIVFKYG